MTALVLARVVHYLAIAQAFGVLVFATSIMRSPVADEAVAQALDRLLASLLKWSVALALVSWLAWLVVQSPAMAGVPLSRVFEGSTLSVVLRDTTFGHVWLLRFVLIAGLAALLALRRSPTKRVGVNSAAMLAGGAAIATLALMGHAAADSGSDRIVHIACDAVHLIAAGAWLGALVPLALALRATSNRSQAYTLARRFSIVGIVAVGGLIATGIVNSVYLVASWPALFGTDYGVLLIAKIALFGAMVGLAATNRVRSTPQLLRDDERAALASRHIVRNARSETALGVGVLVIVGVLGVTIPAAHDALSWPFPFRVSFDQGLIPSIVPAYPTTYARAPVRYTVASVARGAALYQPNCAGCHGSDGHGGDSAGTSPPSPRAHLASQHVLTHRDGDLYGWITQGIAGTPMPAFGVMLDDSARWDLVHFVKALAAGTTIDDAGKPTEEVQAPEFTYQIGHGPQQSIPGAGATASSLLVLYTLPASRERLNELATAVTALEQAGIRVVAVPQRDEGALASDDRLAAAIAATASPGLAGTYELFARNVAPADRAHLEFLIDRDGLLRARWDATSMLPATKLAQEAGAERKYAPRRAVHAH